MKMRILLIALFLFLCGYEASAQVKITTIDALQKRISNPDTVYVVNFWATWCGPCVAELSNFDQLQRVYKNKPLKVLLVSMDYQFKLKTAVIPFVKKHKMIAEINFATRKNDQQLIDAVDKSWSGALPATLLVNTKKHVRQFYEKTFTYDELNKIYQSNK